jgi:hypothetical protein
MFITVAITTRVMLAATCAVLYEKTDVHALSFSMTFSLISKLA